VLAGEAQAPVAVEGQDRRGQAIVCEVSFAPLRDRLGTLGGAILRIEARPERKV
jgi:hypothetical protein